MPFATRPQPDEVAVPLIDLHIQHNQIAAEVAAGWARVLAEGSFVCGPEVEAFERAYARFSGVPHCVGVANGTDAIELALRARGIGRNDDVIVPVNAFNTAAEAVARAGARPVVVDCDPRYLLIDPDRVAERCDRKTRAVLAVHLFGQMAPVEAITNGVPSDVEVIEVASHSTGARRHGRPSGSVAAIAAVSLSPHSSLGGYGNGGAILTSDHWAFDLVRAFGNHDAAASPECEMPGVSSGLDTLQAVVLHAKLRRIERWNDERRAAARRYYAMLVDEPGVRLPATMPGNEHVWHRYVVRVTVRDHVLGRLARSGVAADAPYPTPLRLQAVIASVGDDSVHFPVAESAAREMLSLPIYPGITEVQQERVVTELVAAVRAEAA